MVVSSRKSPRNPRDIRSSGHNRQRRIAVSCWLEPAALRVPVSRYSDASDDGARRRADERHSRTSLIWGVAGVEKGALSGTRRRERSRARHNSPRHRARPPP